MTPMLRRIWTSFVALPPGKRALVGLHLVVFGVGGALLATALEDPQRNSWIFLALGGAWVALLIVIEVLTFVLLARRGGARNTGREPDA